MFQNISHFNNTTQYLSILNGALITDLLFMFFLIFGVFHTKVLEQWYAKYTIAAAMEDTLILVIGSITQPHRIMLHILDEFLKLRGCLLCTK